jgi:hypothetical protein
MNISLSQIGKLATRGIYYILFALISFFSFVIVAFLSFFAFVNVTHAGPGDPFGGMSTMVIYCECTENYVVYFNDLTVTSTTGGLPLIYQPGQTILYDFSMITNSGVWILGTWQSGGVCEILVTYYCYEITTAGTMYMVGTSM